MKITQIDARLDGIKDKEAVASAAGTETADEVRRMLVERLKSPA